MKLIFSDNGMRALLNFRIDVIRHFAARGDEVILIYPQCTHETERECDIPAGCRTIALPVNPTGRSIAEDIRYFRSLKRIYKSERPDAIVHYSIKPNIYGTLAARSAGIKNIAVVAGLGYAFTGNQPGKVIARAMLRFGLRRADTVITLNTVIRDLLLSRHFVHPRRLLLLESGEGVNLDKFRPEVNAATAEPRFLLVARVLFDKGYEEYVQAASEIHKTYPDVHFDLLGPLDTESPMGVPQERLEEDVRSGHIRYLGYMTDPRSEIRRSGTVMVLPSWHEGLSRALMEGVAMGLPVIASDIPGCRELVAEGINGYLCRSHDASSLRDAISRMLNISAEERAEMGRQSRKLAEERFDVQKVIEVYESLIGK